MRIVSCFLLSVLFALASDCQGQYYERDENTVVIVGGTALQNPWAGGLNSCQVSSIDVNIDGKKDLFVFDRIGSRISIFINEDNTPGAINYRYTMEYNHLFPSNLRNWVLLRDMNCDGKEDICSNTGSGFRIYWNESDSELTFSAQPTSSITAFYDWGATSNTSGVYSISPDIPALEDYDNDGDIDMWSWNEFSTGMFFYKNMAVENGDCSLPDYVCRNRCYGMFNESSESSELFMGEEFTCDFNVVDPRSAVTSSQTMRHTGGTTLAVDLDQNGLKDLILGDVTGNELFAVMLMESSTGQDSAFAAYFDFPASFSNTLPAVMTTFLGAYYVDVNNDDVKDLLVSPNSFSDAEDRKSLMLYINEGENDLPAFVKIQDDFLQESMIDLGNSAYPVIFDVNQDGRKDLLIANRKYFEFGNSFTSVIHYYQNTGTAEIPQFELIDDNWLNIPAFNWQSVYPTFGDLNGDGAFDLITGDQEGVLHLMQNAAPAGQPVEFSVAPVTLTDGNDELIDVGQNATPQLFDVDNDGLLDLLIGELNGCVNYYRNTGTQQDYSFILQEDSIGDVAATSLLGIQGRSVPYMIRNGAGLMELFIGTETGQINHYTNIENNIFGQFDLVTTDFENIREGEKSAVTFGDLTNDGLLDLFVGNIAGGVGFYRHIPVSIENEWQAEGIRVYPNPATDRIIISINGHTNQPVLVHVYDVHGKCIMSQNVFGGKAVMSVEALPKGLYVLKAGNAVCRLIK